MADHEELWENSVNVEVKTEKEIEDVDQKCSIKFDPIVVLERLDLSLLKLGKVGDFLVPDGDKWNTGVKSTPYLSLTSLKQSVKSSQNLHINNFDDRKCSSKFSSKWICEQCGVTFTLNRNLKRHVKNKHGTDDLIVVKPEDISSEPSAVGATELPTLLENNRDSNFRQHQTSGSENDRLPRRDVCGKTFNQKCHLRSHLKLHSDTARHKCNKCCVTFTLRRNLQRHMHKKHPCADGNANGDNVVIRQFEKDAVVLPDEPVSDDHIGSVPPGNAHSESSLSKIGDSEMTEKPCKRPVRGKFGKWPHRLKHNWIQRHKCDKCGFTFTTKWNLQRHMRKLHHSSVDNYSLGSDKVVTEHFEQKIELPLESMHASDNSLELISSEGNQSAENNCLCACAVCGMQFEKPSDLISHLHMHWFSREQHKCEKCGLMLTRKWNLQRHMRKCHHSNVDNYSPGSDKVVTEHFEQKIELPLESMHAGDNSLELISSKENQSAENTCLCACEVCGKQFEGPSDLISHLHMHWFSRGRHKCEKCGIVFSLKKNFLKHMRRWHPCSDRNPGNNKLFAKNQKKSCGVQKSAKTWASCMYRKYLLSHIRKSNLRQRVYKCHICGVHTLGKNLQRHINRLHPSEDARTFTQQFAKSAVVIDTSVNDTSSHENGNSEINEGAYYGCSLCEKRYRTVRLLKCHVKMHLGVGGYKCEECGLMFTSKYNLQRHQRTRHQPHHCNDDNVGYDKNVTLQSDESAIPLPMVKNLSDTSVNFDDGISSHSNKNVNPANIHLEHTVSEIDHSETFGKPFGCNLCHKWYKTMQGLEYHMRKHWGIGVHRCDECGSTFTEKYNLRRHQWTSHRRNDDDAGYDENVGHQSDESNVPLPMVESLSDISVNAVYENVSHMSDGLDPNGMKPLLEQISEENCEQSKTCAPYHCEACGLNFVWEHQLRYHQRRHKSSCPYCGMIFNYHNYHKHFKKHIRSCRVDKPLTSVESSCGVEATTSVDGLLQLPDVHEEHPVTQLMPPLPHSPHIQANYNEDTAQTGNVMYFAIKEEPAEEAFESSSALLVGDMADHCMVSDETVSAEPVIVTATLDAPQLD